MTCDQHSFCKLCIKNVLSTVPETPSNLTEFVDINARKCPICREPFYAEDVVPSPRAFREIIASFEVSDFLSLFSFQTNLFQ